MRPVTRIEPPSWRVVRPVAALRRLPEFSGLLWTLAAHRIRIRYKQSRLGVAWAVLQPLSLMLVFVLMFRILGRTPDGSVPYALFAYAALVPWSAFSGGLTSMTASLTGNAALLTKVYFPREIMVLSYVVVALVDLGVAALALFALMAWYGRSMTLQVVWTIPAIVLMMLTLAAVGLVTAAVQVQRRDVGLAMPVVLQAWMFASPVLYSLDAVRNTLPAPLYALYAINPMASVVDTFRRATVLADTPDAQALAIGTVAMLALLPLAYAYFKLREMTMADIV